MPGEFDQTTSGSSGDFNMEAAVSDIASGLGFGEGNDDDNDTGADTGDATAGAGSGTPDEGAITPPAGEGTPGGSDSTVTGGEDGAAKPTTPPSPDLNQPPKTWRKEVSAAWAALPPEVKAEVHKRELDMYSGLEQYKEGANFAWQVRGLFKPYEQVMAQANIAPEQILPNLVQSHGILALGTDDQKLSLMGQLINDYKISVPKLLAQLTGGALTDTDPFVDPAVKALREELGDVKSQLSARTAAETQARQAEIRSSVAAFASDPKNTYFAELSDDIAALIRGGVTKDIKVAYEKALWANPAVRAKEQARVAAEAESERTRKAAEAAAKAKKATAANVRSTARNGSLTAPKSTSIDETLEKTLAEIQARAK